MTKNLYVINSVNGKELSSSYHMNELLPFLDGQSNIQTHKIDLDLTNPGPVLEDINKNADIIFVFHDFATWNNGYHQDSRRFSDFIQHLWSDKHIFVFPTEMASTKLIRSQFEGITHRINKIIVGSEFYKKMFTKFDSNVNIPVNKIKMIGIPASDVQQNQQSAIRAKEKVKFNSKIILSPGLLHPQKDYLELLKNMTHILAKYKKSVFLLSLKQHPRVSEEDGRKVLVDIQNFLDEKNLHDRVKIQFATEESGKKHYESLFRLADLVVFPQDNSFDMYNGALIDAIAAGKAIVAPSSVFAEDLVKKAGILLYTYKDERTFFDAASIILDNKPLREILENQNYELGRTILYPKIAQQYINQIKRFKFN